MNMFRSIVLKARAWLAMALAVCGAALAVALPAAGQVAAGEAYPADSEVRVFNGTAVGQGRRWQSTFSVELVNRGQSAVALGQAKIDGDVMVCMALGCPRVAVGDFAVAGGDGCSGTTLAPGAKCSVQMAFTPTDVGTRVARLVFAVSDGSSVERILSARGTVQPVDCVFDWAERRYKELLVGPTSTFTFAPYVARCYRGGELCVGVDLLAPAAAAPAVFYRQDGQIFRLGSLADYYATVMADETYAFCSL